MQREDGHATGEQQGISAAPGALGGPQETAMEVEEMAVQQHCADQPIGQGAIGGRSQASGGAAVDSSEAFHQQRPAIGIPSEGLRSEDLSEGLRS